MAAGAVRGRADERLALPGFSVRAAQLLSVAMSRQQKLVVAASGHEVSVDVVGPRACPAHLHMRLGSAADCSMSPGSPTQGWPLWERRPSRSPVRLDPFEVMREHLFARLHGVRRRSVERARRLEAEITEALRLSEETAVRLTDPAARQLGRRFHPEARWFVYRGLLGSSSGRFAQLLDVCPGAALLAAAVEMAFPVCGRHAADAPLRDVEDGVRLAKLLRGLLRSWLVLSRDLAATVGKPKHLERPASRCRTCTWWT
jgi:hypothetical protein